MCQWETGCPPGRSDCRGALCLPTEMGGSGRRARDSHQGCTVKHWRIHCCFGFTVIEINICIYIYMHLQIYYPCRENFDYTTVFSLSNPSPSVYTNLLGLVLKRLNSTQWTLWVPYPFLDADTWFLVSRISPKNYFYSRGQIFFVCIQ